jgi:hypothetical protein
MLPLAGSIVDSRGYSRGYASYIWAAAQDMSICTRGKPIQMAAQSVFTFAVHATAFGASTPTANGTYGITVGR